MIARYRIVDRARFLRVLRRFLKYIFIPPIVITVMLSSFLSFVAVDHNSGGYYCDYYDKEGLIYRESHGCSVELGRLSRFFVRTAAVFFIMSSSVSLVFGVGFYGMYFILSRERLGLGKVASENT